MENVRVNALYTTAYVVASGFTATVEHQRTNGEGREVYGWTIAFVDDGDVRFLASEVSDVVMSGVGAGVDALAALDTLLGFLANDGEVYASHMGQTQPDDGYSFGEAFAELAYIHDDAVALAAADVEAAREAEEL